MGTPPQPVEAKRVPGTAVTGSPSPRPLHVHFPTSTTRFVLALIVAITSDIISLIAEIVPPMQLAVDGATALLLFLLLGRNWLILPGLVAEAVPGLAAFPSWIFVVLAIFATERKRRRSGAGAGGALTVWPSDLIADAAAEALRAKDAALREEDAVYGLDSLPEVALHPLIGTGLAAAGFGVLREQPFPHEWVRKLRASESARHAALPVPRDRMRCDLVLTPKPGQTLDDSLIAEKRRRTEAKELEGTLFELLGDSHLAPGAVSHAPSAEHGPHAAPAVPPEEAFWLEIKLVGQFCYSSGIPGPNRAYTSELTRNPLADLKKLAADERIHQAGVLLIVFTADEHVARHDLAVLAGRALGRDLPVPLTGHVTRGVPIPDRIGNTHCTVCLLPLRKA